MSIFRVSACAACLLATPVYAAPVYDIVSVFDNSDPLLDIGPVTIADDGSVAFSLLKSAPGDTEDAHLYLARDGSVTLLSSDSVGVLSNMEQAWMSDNGRYIAGRGLSTGGVFGIWRIDTLDPENPVLIAESGDTVISSVAGFNPGEITVPICSPCSVSNSGTVLFYDNETTGGGAAIVSGSGGSLTAFAYGDREGFDYETGYNQNNSGLRVAVLANDNGTNATAADDTYQFVNGLDATVGTFPPPNDPPPVEAYFSPVITDAGPGGGVSYGAIARRVGGSRQMIINSQSPTITTDGILDRFFIWSMNASQEIVYSASTDFAPNDFSLYTGADPIADRLIGPGDVLFGKVVDRVRLAGYDTINSSGQIAAFVEFTDGTESVIRSRSVGEAILDTAAQISLPGAGNALFGYDIATPPPAPTGVGFNIDFLTGNGAFELLLGGQSYGRYGTGDVDDDGIFRLLGIDPNPFLDPDGSLLFELLFSGTEAAAFRIDDIGLFDRDGRFELIEDFEEGYANGLPFRIREGDAAHVFLTGVAAPAAPVPLPAGVWLLATCLAGLWGLSRKRAL